MKYTNNFLVFKHWKCPNNDTQLVYKSAFCFKFRAFQPVLGSIWDLLGDLVISLCMKPCTKHQVCVRSLNEFSCVVAYLCTACLCTALQTVFLRNDGFWISLHPWSQKRWGHLLTDFTQTFQWVTSHLCWAADSWRRSSQQEQKSSVRLESVTNTLYAHLNALPNVWNNLFLDLSVLVKTTDLLSEPVWKSFNKLLVKHFKYPECLRF